MAPQTYQIGAVRTHLLNDGVYWADGGAVFGLVPRVLWERVIRPDELNRIPMALRCLLIESSEGLILVDTGYGLKLPPKRLQQLNLTSPVRLLDELAALGYRAEDVRIVINTHLHGDHCGGNTCVDAAGQPQATFPNATYLAQRLELADASFPNERTRAAYLAENFMPLTELGSSKDAGRLQLLHGDTVITPQVRVQVTPGHTRAHQVVIVESGGETGVFLADAGYVANLERLAWIPAFDVEPLHSLETKRSLRDWAWRRDALLFFQHDIAVPAGRLRRTDDEWRVEPLIRESRESARIEKD
jgi:glyoxylase-like metal-dependent hydrolase (beta-lactamase superfamily II)